MEHLFNSSANDVIIFFTLGFSLFVIVFMVIIGRGTNKRAKFERLQELKKQLGLAKSLVELAEVRFHRPYQSTQAYKKHKESLKKRRVRVHQMTREIEKLERELGTVNERLT